MNNITCNVIEDLLPLYVEDMLSEDSRKLVDEHLGECEKCHSCLEKLEQETVIVLEKSLPERNADMQAKKAFRGIRRHFIRKIMFSMCISAVCVAAIGRIGYYFYAEKATYIPFEESGLVMQGDQLYTTKSVYARMSSLISPDQKIQFLRLLETKEDNKLYPRTEGYTLITDYSEEGIRNPDGNPEFVIPTLEKVYYLPEEYVNYCFNFEDKEVGEKQTKELEAKSILLWEKTDTE